MICRPCRDAGLMTTAINAHEALTLAVTKTILEREAKGGHAKCPGKTWCDCQHFVGQALNMTLIKAEAVKRSGTEAVAVS